MIVCDKQTGGKRMGKGTGNGPAPQSVGYPVAQDKMRAIRRVEQDIADQLRYADLEQNEEQKSLEYLGVQVIATEAVDICLGWIEGESHHGKIYLLQKAMEFISYAPLTLVRVEEVVISIDEADFLPELRGEFTRLLGNILQAKADVKQKISSVMRMKLLAMHVGKRLQYRQRKAVGY